MGGILGAAPGVGVARPEGVADRESARRLEVNVNIDAMLCGPGDQLAHAANVIRRLGGQLREKARRHRTAQQAMDPDRVESQVDNPGQHGVGVGRVGRQGLVVIGATVGVRQILANGAGLVGWCFMGFCS